MSVARYTLVFSGFKNSDKPTEKEIKDYFESKVGEVVEVTFARKIGRIIWDYRASTNMNWDYKI